MTMAFSATPMDGVVPRVAFFAILDDILNNVSLCFLTVHPFLATKNSFVQVISCDKFVGVYHAILQSSDFYLVVV